MFIITHRRRNIATMILSPSRKQDVHSIGDTAAEALQGSPDCQSFINRSSGLRHKNLIRIHHRLSTGTPHLAAGGAPAPILQRGSSHLGEMPPCVFPDVFLFGSIRFWYDSILIRYLYVSSRIADEIYFVIFWPDRQQLLLPRGGSLTAAAQVNQSWFEP